MQCNWACKRECFINHGKSGSFQKQFHWKSCMKILINQKFQPQSNWIPRLGSDQFVYWQHFLIPPLLRCHASNPQKRKIGKAFGNNSTTWESLIGQIKKAINKKIRDKDDADGNIKGYIHHPYCLYTEICFNGQIDNLELCVFLIFSFVYWKNFILWNNKKWRGFQ